MPDTVQALKADQIIRRTVIQEYELPNEDEHGTLIVHIHVPPENGRSLEDS